MNKQSTIGIVISITAVIVAFALGLTIGNDPRTLGANNEKLMEAEIKSSIPLGAIKYNCELSLGTFKDGRCECILEMAQTQEEMYDEQTGYCQSTQGGPAGDAFNASIGLPFADYSFWSGIVLGLCEESGGSISGVSCICPSGKTYDETSGMCK